MIQILLIGISLTVGAAVIAMLLFPHISKLRLFSVLFGVFLMASAIFLVLLYRAAYTLPDDAIPIRTDKLQNQL